MILEDVSELVADYPPTRYMGSKRKVLPFIQDVLSSLEYESCLDAFSGSGIVSYYFKKIGKEVYSNDFMRLPYMCNVAEIVVHPQSIVHSMIRYRDGSVLAQLGQPDMRTPIAYLPNMFVVPNTLSNNCWFQVIINNRFTWFW